jgi:hypothetical protein
MNKIIDNNIYINELHLKSRLSLWVKQSPKIGVIRVESYKECNTWKTRKVFEYFDKEISIQDNKHH